jgi:hypothetical protein
MGLYNRALTIDEITAHYNGGAGQSLCNSAPVALDDELTTDEDTPVDFTATELLADDTDPDGIDPTLDSIDAASTQGGTITDNGGGNYTYTPPVDFNGADTFTYTIIDGAGATDVGTVTVTVGNVNDPPDVTNPGAQTNNEGDSPSLQIVADDLDGDTLTYSASNLPTGLSINENTGLISGTISQTAAQASPYDVTVTVTDLTTPVDVDFTWTVNMVNVPPVVTKPADQEHGEGASVSLQIVASDVDGDDLEYSALGLPPGLSINASTGLITGTIAAGAKDFSPYTVTVKAKEVGTIQEYEDEETFTWTINNPPEVTNPGDQANFEGQTVSLPIIATDEDGDTLSYSATGLPLGLSINAATGVISGKIHTGTAGSYTVTVTVSDGISDVEVEFGWEVTAVPFVYLPIIINQGD